MDKGWGNSWGMLTTHFRMHNEIAELINPWYAMQLKTGKESQLQPFVPFSVPSESLLEKAMSAGRLVFLPSPLEKTHKHHYTEAQRIVTLLQYIKKAKGSGFNGDSVGVVTPWRTQIAEIRNLIGDDRSFDDITIETVERFQGSEKDIILVSLSVYHSGQLKVLRSPGVFRWADNSSNSVVALDRKLLVTVSRARQQVIFLGDERVINSDKHYSSVVGKMQRFDLANANMPF